MNSKIYSDINDYKEALQALKESGHVFAKPLCGDRLKITLKEKGIKYRAEDIGWGVEEIVLEKKTRR